MHVLVTPMRSLGIALDPKARRQFPAIIGNFHGDLIHLQRAGTRYRRLSRRCGHSGRPRSLAPFLEAIFAGIVVTTIYSAALSSLMVTRARSLGGAWKCGRELMSVHATKRWSITPPIRLINGSRDLWLNDFILPSSMTSLYGV